MMRKTLLALAVTLLTAAPALSEQPGPDDLSVQSAFALAERQPSQFARQWRNRYDRARRAKDANPSALKAAYARGLIDYAYFHWRETGEQTPANWHPLQSATGAIAINDPQLIELPEHREFLASWLRHQARQALSEPALQRGDNVWLRARFQVVEAQVQNNDVRRFLLREALATHLEENSAIGLPALIDRFASMTSASAPEVEALREAAVADLASRDGHRIEVYKTANDTELALHILPPSQPQAGARPALIWFHGGSWTTGSWAHCPMVCRLAREQGYVSVQVEYRTNDRFNTTPMEAIADGRDALAFISARASDLSIAPDRIVVSGFSAGGTIAATLATSSPPRSVRAALLVSACTNPLSDSWSRRVSSGETLKRDLSPIDNLDAEDATILAVQGTGDQICPYEDAKAFVVAAQSAGLEADLVTLEGASHFFVFNNPPARAQANARVAAFLARWR